jgi:uncharacterized protein YggT (Ycf19 family)
MRHWPYHLADLLLAAFCYLVIVRLLLSPLATTNNPMVRAVRALTQPLLAAVGAITPRMVPSPLLLLGALTWLYAARVILRAGVAATGVRLG